MSDGADRAVPAPPKSSGHVNVGVLDVYYERHGHGAPLVPLHGAMGTIESCFAGLLPALATTSRWSRSNCKAKVTPATSLDR